MSDKRRAEIEAKRLKLAELRKARADRQKLDLERRAEVRSAVPLPTPHLTFLFINPAILLPKGLVE